MPRPKRERGGSPPLPAELMVRVLLIQQLFDLNDERMKFRLLDRVSFERFVSPSGKTNYVAGYDVFANNLKTVTLQYQIGSAAKVGWG